MSKTIVSLVLSVSLAAGLTVSIPAAQATPGGCLKYGAAGAVAGHAVHHGVKGFLAGCAAGMYRRHLYNKQQRAIKNGTAPAGPAPAGAPGPT